MIKVAGVWEFGWNTPLQEFDLWAFPLRDYNVDEFIMSPVTGIQRKVTEFVTFEDVISANPGLTPVFVEEEGAGYLDDFEHPADALYLFGRAGYSPWKARGKKGLSVKIETASGKGLLWPHQCATTVLRDRMLKNGFNHNGQ